MTTHRTTAVPSADPHHDARVIWSGDGKRIVVDNRPRPTPSPPQQPLPQQRPPFRCVIVKGRKQK